MGFLKHLLAEEEGKRQIALSIAIEAGVIEECDNHDNTFFQGGTDIEDAYKLGNSKWSKGELQNIFANRREMTDIIQDVVEENCAFECASCAIWLED